MASKIDTEDLVICPICYEQFTNPKCLPCLHSFCHLCLKSYIIKQHDGEGKTAKEFPCPVCRQVATVTDMSLTSEKIADSLPGNHLMNCLIERSKTAEQSPNKKECGPCDFDDQKTVAVSWCTYCLEPLCGDCAHSHKRFKHVIVNVETAPKENPTQFPEADEPCMKHAGKVLEVYCVDHGEMCCVICLATSHRKCEHISTFEEMVMGPDNVDSVDQFSSCLHEIDKKTESLEMKVDENLSHLDIRHGEIHKQVTATIQQVHDNVDVFKTNCLANLDLVHKTEMTKLTEKKERVTVFLKSVKKAQKLLHVVRECGSPKQLFITTEKIKMQLKQHMELLKVDLKNMNSSEYVFNTEDILESLTNAITSVAQVEVKPTPGLSTHLDAVFNAMTCACKMENNNPVDIMDLKIDKEFTILHTNCEITGGTSSPDERLVLCCYTEAKLKAFDKEGRKLFENQCNHEPTDVCLISPSEIVVSFYNQKCIKKYRIQQTAFNEMKTVPCKEGPWGLAATNDIIIVGYRNEIDVLSVDGKFLRNFSSRGGGDHVSSIAVSLTNNVHYIDGNDIVCKTLEGKEISRFTHPSLRRLMGIAVDKYGNVYVCGHDSGNVCVFSPDGQRSKVMIATIKNPEKIILDFTETKLCVTTYNSGVFCYHPKNRKTLSEPRK